MDGSSSKEDDDSPDQFLTNPSYHPTNGMITEYSTHSNRDKPASSYRPSDTVLWRATQTHSRQMQGSAYATTQNTASMNPYRPSDTDLWHPATPQIMMRFVSLCKDKPGFCPCARTKYFLTLFHNSNCVSTRLKVI